MWQTSLVSLTTGENNQMVQWNPTLQTLLNCRHLDYADTFKSPDDLVYSTNVNLPLKGGHPANPYSGQHLLHWPIQ